MKDTETKHLPVLRRLRQGVTLLVLACAVAATAGVWHSSAFKENDKAAVKREFHERVRDGIGREAYFRPRGGSAESVHPSVNSMAQFIERRSGVKLSGATKNRLAEMEERVQSGHARGLTVGELSHIITVTTVERVATLSDQEIAHVDDTLRGFKAPGIPSNFSRDLHLPDGYVFIGTPPEKTTAQLKAVRDQLNGPTGEVFQAMIGQHVRKRVQSRASYLSEAVPEKFGNMWDVANDQERGAGDGGITPLQATLIAYSLVSSDALSDSDASLEKRMRRFQSAASRVLGQPYPGPDGHRAYGVNGYHFSSPLDLLFDERVVNRILDRIAERSAP
jgi:hypothetical protein